MEQSLTKTLARKFKLSVPQVYEKYRTTLMVDKKPYKGLQLVIPREGKKPLVAQWGGISLKRRPDAILNDQASVGWNARTELVKRLLADTCELCGSQESIQVHHIRELKDLKRSGRREQPAWVKVMAARHRKTLVLCLQCHTAIHQGRPLDTAFVNTAVPESQDETKESRPVRRGADGKGL